MKDRIISLSRELGFDQIGFASANPPEHAQVFLGWVEAGHHGEMAYLPRNAEKRIDPQKVLPGARSIIVLATSYHQSTPAGSKSLSEDSTSGQIARYARFIDYHHILAPKLAALSESICLLGGEGARALWYTDTGPLLERDLGQRAGVGFAGKHTNLISQQLGNWFFLSEILTTVPLEPDSPEKNRCGRCTLCLTACPTNAFVGPFQLDARRCISYLTIELKGSIPIEFRPLLGNRIYGCDDCLKVCPWNRFAREGEMMKGHYREGMAQPDLLELLQLDEGGFRHRFAGTPMLRTKRRGLLRNVCVALGNVGDRRALPMLERACSDSEALIAEHARWAVEQIEERTASPVQSQIPDALSI